MEALSQPTPRTMDLKSPNRFRPGLHLQPGAEFAHIGNLKDTAEIVKSNDDVIPKPSPQISNHAIRGGNKFINLNSQATPSPVPELRLPGPPSGSKLGARDSEGGGPEASGIK